VLGEPLRGPGVGVLDAARAVAGVAAGDVFRAEFDVLGAVTVRVVA
jgi:hypothetical protein